MKIDGDTLLTPDAAAGAAAPLARAWPWAAALTLAAALWLLAWYGDTAASIVSIWDRSETFAHGFLVLPVFAYLVWIKRRFVAAVAPRPTWAGLALLALLGFGWLFAYLGQVQVVMQLAMVAMIPALVLTVLGWRAAWMLAFPLAFLLLGVPMGEALIPPMMDFTADFTVGMLQLSGIPVFREGTFFTIPSGEWSVVEGCSGLRYLIASIFAGCLYAYLTYTRLAKRLVFIAASVIVPVLANGLRAYMIVMIAHLSDMRLALGVDHFIYGWVWFGVVITLMFWIGARWRDPEPVVAPAGAAGEPALKGVLGAAVAAALVIAVWPAYAAYLDRAMPNVAQPALRVPAAAAGWQAEPTPATDWRPHYTGADASLFQSYRKGDRVVSLYLGYYRKQRQDAELVSSVNVMVVQKHPVWQNVGEAGRSEALGGSPVAIRQTSLRSPVQRLLLWDWFLVSGRYTSSGPLAKLLLARDRLLGERDDGVALILAAPYEGKREPAQEALREFVRDMLPSIEATLREAENS